MNAEARISDLIRRVRVKSNLAPVSSPNPRILFHGQQVGHAMTVGELGIAKDEKVMFTYDGAEDEEV